MEFLTEQFDHQDAVTLDRLISEYARPNMVVFELGTYTGRASLVMLYHIKRMSGMLYCVDWFKGNPGAADINTSYDHYKILDVLLENIREAGFEENSTVMVGRTTDVAAVIEDRSVDFVFVDADHRYSFIRNDIVSWYPKLKDGGLICGHDFETHLKNCDREQILLYSEEDFTNGHHYGVIRAVSEFFPNVKREGRIWYAKKGAHPTPDLDQAIAENRRQMGMLNPVRLEQHHRMDDSMPEQPPQSGIRSSETVDRHLEYLFAPNVVSLSPDVQLIEGGYQGFDIIKYWNRFYALHQVLGKINLIQLDEDVMIRYQENDQCFVADSLDEVKQRVDQLFPVLVEESYFGFNLVCYRNMFYALALKLGHIDLAKLSEGELDEYQANGQCFIGSTLDEAKHLTAKFALDKREQEMMALRQEVAASQGKLNLSQQELTVANEELRKIKSSRWFRARNRLNKMVRIS